MGPSNKDGTPKRRGQAQGKRSVRQNDEGKIMWAKRWGKKGLTEDFGLVLACRSRVKGYTSEFSSAGQDAHPYDAFASGFSSAGQ